MNCLEQISHPEHASKKLQCLTVSFFLLTAATRNTDTNSTHNSCFLRLDTTSPECTCSVIHNSHQKQCHHLSIPHDIPHTCPPYLSNPAFRFQAVRVILRLPLTSNTSDKIILKPTSDGWSPCSSWIMTPIYTSCDIVLVITTFLAVVSKYCIVERVNGLALQLAPVIVAWSHCLWDFVTSPMNPRSIETSANK